MHVAVPPGGDDDRQSAETTTAGLPVQTTVAVPLVLSMTEVTTVFPAGFFSTMGKEVRLAVEYCVS